MLILLLRIGLKRGVLAAGAASTADPIDSLKVDLLLFLVPTGQLAERAVEYCVAIAHDRSEVMSETPCTRAESLARV